MTENAAEIALIGIRNAHTLAAAFIVVNEELHVADSLSIDLGNSRSIFIYSTPVVFLFSMSQND